MVSFDIIHALKRPFTDLKKLIIGILLNIVPIVSFFAMGYVIQCIKKTLKNEEALPPWEHWGNLFIKGLFTTIILVVWMIPIMLIYLFVNLELALTTLGVVLGIIAFIITGFWHLVAVMLFIVYLLPLAIVSYAAEDKFTAAFNIPVLVRKAFNKVYPLPWLISVAIGAVLSFLAALSGIYAVFFLTAAAFFISMIIGGTLIAQVYRKL